MNVSLIGSGNVATVLGRLIKSAGHTIDSVTSPTMLHAETLAKDLNAKANTNLETITHNSDIYIIAVSDTAIKELADTIKLPGKIIVHTCGAVSKNTLQKITNQYGALYPLQSLRKEAAHIPVIPILVDGSSAETKETIQAFAKSISSQVGFANDDERLKLHLAAVIVSNFTNHLYALTQEYCKMEAVDFSMLLPLIQETGNRIKEYAPMRMQTGPAVRGDLGTIYSHLQLLAAHPELRKIYNEFTESIVQLHKQGD